ncbi:MAG: hypothetical protein HUJ51_02770, partial [Eggerthellaceae bacterium]|nr:hypothetical protein [Eggerthellaceae bacterium]
GTLNVGSCFPSVAEFIAIIFALNTVPEVDPLTILCMIVAAILGASFGVRVVIKLNINSIRIALAVALFISSIFLIGKQLQIGAYGIQGSLTKLDGISLVVASTFNFIFAAMSNVGCGLYAPCLAMLNTFNLNTKLCFPILSGSTSGSQPSASFKYVQSGKYDRVAAVCLNLAGIPGAIFAAIFIAELDVYYLLWLVIGIMYYTIIMYVIDVVKNK